MKQAIFCGLADASSSLACLDHSFSILTFHLPAVQQIEKVIAIFSSPSTKISYIRMFALHRYIGSLSQFNFDAKFAVFVSRKRIA